MVHKSSWISDCAKEFDTFTEFLSEQISGVTDEIRDDVKSIDLNRIYFLD